MLKRLALFIVLLLLAIPHPALAAISFINSWGGTNVADNYFTVNTSTGNQIQVGDVLVCSDEWYSGNDTPPSGFSIAVAKFLSGNIYQTVYYKVTGSGDVG